MNKTLRFLTCFLLIASAAAAKSALPPYTTQVQGCGQTLPSLDSPITANLVAGVSGYRFRVTTISSSSSVPVQIVTSNIRTFKLTQLAEYAFDRTYSIEVAVRHGNDWYPYGPACVINSPSPTTSLTGSFCGITVSAISDPIYAQSVPFSQGYRFRLTNLLDQSEVYVIDRPLREFRLNNFNVRSGVTYLVEVAVKNFDGEYLQYGPACSVTAPILYTKLSGFYCGKTLGAMSDNIMADLIAGAYGYRFRITDMTNPSNVQILNRPVRSFSMNMLSGIQYSRPYKVEVSIKDVSGTYLAYGPICTVYTPPAPIPKIQLSQCELVGPALDETIYADEYPNATVYRFKLENAEVGYSQFIDRPVRTYNLAMFSELIPNTAYTVRVAVKVNGNFTPFGKACDVTTPGVTARQAQNTINSTMPILYPNPYSDYFSIDALPSDAEVSVRIYDMTGRLLETHAVSGADVPALQLGRNFPSGVYNVITQQSGTIRSFRVVKR